MKTVLWLASGFAAFEVGGNLAIVAAQLIARRRSPRPTAAWGRGAANAYKTTDLLWRSGRPDAGTYQAVADAGAGLVIDLRAEGGAGPDPGLGLDVLRLPVHDGRAPEPHTVAAFRRALDDADGPVLVHCSAGVGRTGTLIAARLVLDEGWSARSALREVLSVGPPSLEQIDFVLGLPRRLRPRRTALVISRVLDAPRRIWSRVSGLFHRRRSRAGGR